MSKEASEVLLSVGPEASAVDAQRGAAAQDATAGEENQLEPVSSGNISFSGFARLSVYA
jgi:hypothetical protein